MIANADKGEGEVEVTPSVTMEIQIKLLDLGLGHDTKSTASPEALSPYPTFAVTLFSVRLYPIQLTSNGREVSQIQIHG